MTPFSYCCTTLSERPTAIIPSMTRITMTAKIAPTGITSLPRLQRSDKRVTGEPPPGEQEGIRTEIASVRRNNRRQNRHDHKGYRLGRRALARGHRQGGHRQDHGGGRPRGWPWPAPGAESC